jgi:hypothetical protein
VTALQERRVENHLLSLPLQFDPNVAKTVRDLYGAEVEREREVGTRKDRRENTRSTQDHKNLFGLPFREPTCLSILRRDAF